MFSGAVLKDREMLRRIGNLAGPAVLEQALQTAVQYADTAMVGQIGAAASAAVGLTMSCTWLVNGPLFAMGIGVLACIAQALGAGDATRARKAGVQGVFLVLFLGILMGVLTVALAPFIPYWLGTEAALAKDAGYYFAITCLPMIFRAGNIVFASALRGAGDSRRPMLINLAMNVCNVLLNYLLINPAHLLDIGFVALPLWGAGMGVRGAAVATALSHVLGGTLMAWAYWRHPTLSPRQCGVRVDRALMRRIISIGLPVTGERVAACLGQVVFTGLVSRLGTLALAAHSIALTAEQAFYIPGYGMQAAASTLAGNALGEGNEKKLRDTSLTITFIAAALMALMGAALFSFPEALMGIFTGDREVMTLGASVLRIVAVSEPLFAVAIIMEGVCNGIGDTRASFMISAGTMWGVRIAGTLMCVYVFHGGLQAVWCCMVADNTCRCCLLLLRFLRGRWKRRLNILAQQR